MELQHITARPTPANSVDGLLVEVYDRKTNNCLHFAARVWTHLTGDERLTLVREAALSDVRTIMRGFRRVSGPTREPSIALMETHGGEAHIGICMRRRLLHLCERGAEFLPVECYRGVYSDMRFYQ